jgi:phosphohistidine phosphatase
VFIYLIRHGSAVDLDTPGVNSDGERYLTDKAIEKTRQQARVLVDLGIRIDEAWTSPLIRCRQTAEIFQKEIPALDQVYTNEALAPGSNFDALIDQLERCVDTTGIALIGHEPDLGKFATYLMTGERIHGIRFKKGAIACIETEKLSPPRGNQLRWMLTPKMMNNIKVK